MRPENDSQSEGRVLDLDVIAELRELGGDDDPGLLLELIETFIEDAPRLLAEMERAFEDSDLERMERAAHTLKSSSASMGGLVLCGVCSEMEAAAREGDTQVYQLETARCRSAFRVFEAALRALD